MASRQEGSSRRSGGRNVGQFTIDKEIGKGSFAQVYMGWHKVRYFRDGVAPKVCLRPLSSAALCCLPAFSLSYLLSLRLISPILSPLIFSYPSSSPCLLRKDMYANHAWLQPGNKSCRGHQIRRTRSPEQETERKSIWRNPDPQDPPTPAYRCPS